MERSRAVQLQIDLPYKKQPREDKRIAAYLARGYRIVNLHRLSDAEVLVTFEGPPAADA